MSLDLFTEEVEEQKKRGVLIIITGPTAVGKDTIMKLLLSRRQNLTRMITTNKNFHIFYYLFQISSQFYYVLY